ncbi:MAG: FAD-binding protein [Dehalogenimonas sp.]
MENIKWDSEVDVIVVGTGAAGSAAASVAFSKGSSVLMLEKGKMVGGTTMKSGGQPWIPNNVFLRNLGTVDDRQDCLKFMARGNYPQLYDPTNPHFGLMDQEYNLLEAYYDNGYKAIDYFMNIGACQFVLSQPVLPDYVDHVPENKLLRGRLVAPANPQGMTGFGIDLIKQFSKWIKDHGIPVLLNHRARRILLNDRRETIGIRAELPDGTVKNFRAKKAVVFGCGGFTHNRDLILHFQKGPTFGGCAVITNTGDLVYMGQAVGAQLSNMNGAWNAEIPLEPALELSSTPDDIWQPLGDSMILVNRYGKRVVNEKRNYNDRTKAHFYWDPVEQEYPNQILCMIYDQRTVDVYGDSPEPYPVPPPGTKEHYVIEGKDWDDLGRNIRQRVGELAPRIGNWRLADGFEENLKQTVLRFNQFANRGIDEDFQRGSFPYDVEWHTQIFSIPSKDTKWPENDRPNPTMYPFTASGPYYCILIAGGTLDTNGGPRIDPGAHILDTENRPIPGLYGAGNCIAAPMPNYIAGGATLGNALTFGYVAGLNAAEEKLKEIA